MKFNKTIFPDVWLIELERSADSRGFFARTFCIREFAARGLETAFVQHSLSYSKERGTLRGMHFQTPPHEEVKVVSSAGTSSLLIVVSVAACVWVCRCKFSRGRGGFQNYAQSIVF